MVGTVNICCEFDEYIHEVAKVHYLELSEGIVYRRSRPYHLLQAADEAARLPPDLQHKVQGVSTACACTPQPTP